MSAGRRVVRRRGGAQILEGDAVISEIRSRPGPSHRFVDLMAAAVAALAPGPRVLMLGFAGGGVVAPLRGLGWNGDVHAVDLSAEGEDLFRDLCGTWAGSVTLEIGEAAAWLRRNRRRWDLIFDDLSYCEDGVVTKPAVSYGELPERIATRLAPGGIAVVNLLPVAGHSWARLEARISAPWPHNLVISTDDYENRLLIAGRQLPAARQAGSLVRQRLALLGSRMRAQVHVRTVRPAARSPDL